MIYELSYGRVIGLSTDTKPTTTSTPRVTAGIRFIEVDTGLIYIWDGTQWVLYTETIKINPHVDLDTTYVWANGVPTQVVTTGLGKTTTEILNWSGVELQSIVTVIT